jgi:hypothetical protein
MDIDGQKLRDTFLWNKNETLLSPEQVGAFFESFGQGTVQKRRKGKIRGFGSQHSVYFFMHLGLSMSN